MNNEDRDFNVERGRQRVRAAIVLILLVTISAAIFTPGVLEGETKSLAVGAWIEALGIAIVFFFTKKD